MMQSLRKQTVVMLVTADVFEMPVALFESTLSIARHFGVSQRCIRYAISEHRKFQKEFFIEKVNLRNNSENPLYNQNVNKATA